MNIKPMLVRLEGAMERNDLAAKMVLLPEPASAASKGVTSTQAVNLVVGYNASPNSQIALDLTMWIAHQTRLATQKKVTVQVVYVVDAIEGNKCPDIFKLADVSRSSIHPFPPDCPNASVSSKSATAVLTKPELEAIAVDQPRKSLKEFPSKASGRQFDWFEQADHILWQARCLAQEWRGSFKAHLRFGDIATELTNVVESEAATLLFLGCNDAHHPLVQKLGSNFPCSVLGIPRELSFEDSSDFPYGFR
ncbi:MAG TPA: universal stress protein [Coleofasciculaceae cyanobacterium]